MGNERKLAEHYCLFEHQIVQVGREHVVVIEFLQQLVIVYHLVYAQHEQGARTCNRFAILFVVDEFSCAFLVHMQRVNKCLCGQLQGSLLLILVRVMKVVFLVIVYINNAVDRHV